MGQAFLSGKKKIIKPKVSHGITRHFQAAPERNLFLPAVLQMPWVLSVRAFAAPDSQVLMIPV